MVATRSILVSVMQKEERLIDDVCVYIRYSRLKPLWGKPCLFIGANRIGKEGNTQFQGQSCILSLQDGKVLARASTTFQGLLTANFYSDKCKSSKSSSTPTCG